MKLSFRKNIIKTTSLITPCSLVYSLHISLVSCYSIIVFCNLLLVGDEMTELPIRPMVHIFEDKPWPRVSCDNLSSHHQSGALSLLVGIIEIVLSLVEDFIELKYFHDVATPAPLCHKEPSL